MITITLQDAQNHLPQWLHQMEQSHEIIRIFHNGKPVADLIPPLLAVNPLQQHEEIRNIHIHYDPVATLLRDEWSEELEVVICPS